MSVRLVCAICGHELIRVGVTDQLGCPLHGSRWQVDPNLKPHKPPSKINLRDPDYDFGTST